VMEMRRQGQSTRYKVPKPLDSTAGRYIRGGLLT
jgi:hypothetical protein